MAFAIAQHNVETGNGFKITSYLQTTALQNGKSALCAYGFDGLIGVLIVARDENSKSNSPKYVCLKCKNKIPIVDLEGVFIEQLRSFIFSDEEIAKYLEEADGTAKTKEEQIGALEKERTSVSRDMDKLYDLYLKDGINSDAFGERYRPLEERRKQIDETLPKLEAELDIFRINLRSKDVIISEARDLYGRWPKLPFEDKRRIVETIVDRIIIAKDDIEIALHFVPPSHSNISENSGKKATHRHGFIAATS